MGGIWQPGAPASGPYVIIGTDGRLSAARTLTGTANQIAVTDNGSSVVLSIPGGTPAPATRSISTTSPLAGGGDLSADRTVTLAGLSGLGSANQIIGVNSGATAWESKTLSGTTNQVILTHAANSVTWGLPQNIDTSASPTLAGLTLSGLTASRLTSTNGSQALVSTSLASWVTGTTNQITIADDGDGTITISGPQDVHTGASPSFAGLITTGQVAHRVDPYGTAAGQTGELRFLELVANGTHYVGFKTVDSLAGSVIWTLPSADGTNGQVLQTNGLGALSWGTSSSGAPTDASYITLGLNGSLSAERVLTGTSNQVTVTDGGANGNVTLSTPQDTHTGASPTFTGLTLSGLTAGSVPFAGSGGLISQDNASLFWDDANNRLGLGTASPSMRLHLLHSANTVTGAFLNNSMATGNTATRTRLVLRYAEGGFTRTWALQTPGSTTQDGGFSIVDLGNTTDPTTAGTLRAVIALNSGLNLYQPAGTTLPQQLLNFRGSGSTNWAVWLGSETPNYLYIGGSASTTQYYWRANWSATSAPSNTFKSASDTAAQVPVGIVGAASQSGNLTEWYSNTGTVYSTVSENGYFTTRKTSAPADGELATGELAFWFDSTAGAAKCMIKAKDANGTVVTGSVALA